VDTVSVIMSVEASFAKIYEERRYRVTPASNLGFCAIRDHTRNRAGHSHTEGAADTSLCHAQIEAERKITTEPSTSMHVSRAKADL
jgi:hypothetical protein